MRHFFTYTRVRPRCCSSNCRIQAQELLYIKISIDLGRRAVVRNGLPIRKMYKITLKQVCPTEILLIGLVFISEVVKRATIRSYCWTGSTVNAGQGEEMRVGIRIYIIKTCDDSRHTSQYNQSKNFPYWT